VNYHFVPTYLRIVIVVHETGSRIWPQVPPTIVEEISSVEEVFDLIFNSSIYEIFIKLKRIIY